MKLGDNYISNRRFSKSQEQREANRDKVFKVVRLIVFLILWIFVLWSIPIGWIR
jgi:hypothetical protein